MPLSIWRISSRRNDDVAGYIALELAWAVLEEDEKLSHRSANVLVVNQGETKVYGTAKNRWIWVLQAVQNCRSMTLNLIKR